MLIKQRLQNSSLHLPSSFDEGYTPTEGEGDGVRKAEFVADLQPRTQVEDCPCRVLERGSREWEWCQSTGGSWSSVLAALINWKSFLWDAQAAFSNSSVGDCIFFILLCRTHQPLGKVGAGQGVCGQSCWLCDAKCGIGLAGLRRTFRCCWKSFWGHWWPPALFSAVGNVVLKLSKAMDF